MLFDDWREILIRQNGSRLWSPRFTQRHGMGLFVLAAVGLLAPPLSYADGAHLYALSDIRETGELTRVKLSLNAQGHLFHRAQEDAKSQSPLRVAAEQIYDEQLLSDASARPADGAAVLRSLRYYRDTRTEIKVGEIVDRPVLESHHRLILTELGRGALTILAPAGPLSRGELDLIEMPGNGNVVYSLLPDKQVKLDESWQHDDQVLATLFNFESITTNEVQSRLAKVVRDTAQVRLAGTISGAVAGASTRMDVQGEFRFDLRRKRINWVELQTYEKRSAGHVMPGLDVTARLRMLIAPIDTSKPLEAAVADIESLTTGPNHELLNFICERGRYRTFHDRRWHVVADDRDGTIMRLVDRGDLLAQCNISQLNDLPPGKQVGLEEFQSDIQRSLAKQFGEFIDATQATTEDGRHILRAVALGTVSGVPIQWIYYHLSSPNRRQSAIVFTLEAALAERFGESDRALVDNFTFADGENEPDRHNAVANGGQSPSATRGG